MLSIIYSKKGNLVPRLKIEEGHYLYELKKIKPFIETNIRILEGELNRFHAELNKAIEMQAVCDIAHDISIVGKAKSELMKEVAL